MDKTLASFQTSPFSVVLFWLISCTWCHTAVAQMAKMYSFRIGKGGRGGCGGVEYGNLS